MYKELFDLSGKVAVVTGASANGGLGHIMSLAFAEYGADVVISDIDDAGVAAAAAAGQPIYYRHPHDPARTSPVPRQDEMGMDYVPVFADAAGPEVRVSPAVINNLGVRTEPATIAAPARRATTVGYVTFDERRMHQVQPRAEGWIEGLAVRAAGETVQAGQLLFSVYSPMLESAQQEFLDAQRIGNADLIAASGERLGALGLEAGTAERLSRSGRASGRVPFHAPITWRALILFQSNPGLIEQVSARKRRISMQRQQPGFVQFAWTESDWLTDD